MRVTWERLSQIGISATVCLRDAASAAPAGHTDTLALSPIYIEGKDWWPKRYLLPNWHNS